MVCKTNVCTSVSLVKNKIKVCERFFFSFEMKWSKGMRESMFLICPAKIHQWKHKWQQHTETNLWTNNWIFIIASHRIPTRTSSKVNNAKKVNIPNKSRNFKTTQARKCSDGQIFNPMNIQVKSSDWNSNAMPNMTSEVGQNSVWWKQGVRILNRKEEKQPVASDDGKRQEGIANEGEGSMEQLAGRVKWRNCTGNHHGADFCDDTSDDTYSKSVRSCEDVWGMTDATAPYRSRGSLKAWTCWPQPTRW